MSIKYSFEEIYDNLYKNGFCLLVSKADFKGVTVTPLYCIDKDGYKYKVVYDAIMRGKTDLDKVHKSNPFSIHNINLYLSKYSNGEYSCISDVYGGKNEEIEIKHNVCGRVFKNSWAKIGRTRYLDSLDSNKTGAFCPFCNAKKLESSHALILKQVWQHKYPETVTEDKSCINPKTSCVLPTDIVNHRLKIAIEVQSWFHDFPDQKEKDRIKKDYWLNRKYKFYAVDQRDYTILEMIQLFFPTIREIPDYIDFGYSNKMNDVLVHRMLNQGYTVPEIAEISGYSRHNIYDAISYGRVSYPKNYYNSSYSPVVQLDINKAYIAEYPTIKSAGEANGIIPGNITSCLLNKKHYANGYLWIYKKDYISGKYAIPEPKIKKFLIPVSKYDMEGNLIKKYENILEAAKEVKRNDSYAILENVNGKRKSLYGFVYKKTIL